MRLPLIYGAICYLILIFSSCSKDLENNYTGETVISLELSGASPKTENRDNYVLQASNTPIGTEEYLNFSSFSKEDFIFENASSQEEIRLEENDFDSFSNKLTKNAATVPMQTGIKYGFILFNQTDNKLVAKVVGISGKLTNFTVSGSKTYRWYAYSYNSTEDIILPNIENPIVETLVDKPFLYATGTLTPSSSRYNLSVTFNHMLTQLSFEADSRGLFGDITAIEAQFENNYIKTTDFNILTGQKVGSLKTLDVGNLTFKNVNEGSLRRKKASYYTADENLTSYNVKITRLVAQHPNNIVKDLTSTLPNNGVSKFNGFSASNAGNILMGELNLWLLLPEKKIILYGRHNGWGYGGELGRASGEFLRSSYNFGPSSSFLKIKKITYEQINIGNNRLSDRMANPANYPDAVIMGAFDEASDRDYDELYNYLDRGGVVFLMTESTSKRTLDFIRDVFNAPNIKMDRSDNGGSVYQLRSVDPDVLDGVFGDVRGKLWGQDASSTLYITNYTGNEAVVYTTNSSNEKPKSDVIDGISMFRHKTKNLFYVGDTGFLANGLFSGTYTFAQYNTAGPFATKGGSGPDQHFPNVRQYGHNAQSGTPLYLAGKRIAPYEIYNSYIFGNVLAWMLERSHFAGIDRN